MLISVIVPIYNAENYIERCVSSILNQSYTKFELILINDGSKDESLKLLEKFKIQDSRIDIINQENKGVSAARNVGIKYSTGDYITFVDADDWVEKDYLLAFTKSNLKINVLNIQNVTRDNHLLSHFGNTSYNITSEIDSLIQLDLLRLGFPFAKFYNSKIIKNNKIYFLENVTMAEDLLFFLEYMKYIEYLNFLEVSNYNYIYNQTSARTKSHSFESLNMYRMEVEKLLTNHNLNNKSKRKIFKILWDVLESSIHQGFYNKNLDENRKKENLIRLNKQITLNYFFNSRTLNRKILYFLIKIKKIKLLDKYVSFIMRENT